LTPLYKGKPQGQLQKSKKDPDVCRHCDDAGTGMDGKTKRLSGYKDWPGLAMLVLPGACGNHAAGEYFTDDANINELSY